MSSKDLTPNYARKKNYNSTQYVEKYFTYTKEKEAHEKKKKFLLTLG
jgi:hypothetical protein